MNNFISNLFLIICLTIISNATIGETNGNSIASHHNDSSLYKFHMKNSTKLSDKNYFLFNSIDDKQNYSSHSKKNFKGLSLKSFLNYLIESPSFMPEIYILKNNDTSYLKNQAKTYNNEKFNILNNLIKFAESHIISIPLSFTEDSGRLFFFKGMKKLMWPLLVAIQIIKLTLFAIFLPSLVGSVGKIVNKGITQVSGFSNNDQHQMDNLSFRDNFEDLENKHKFSYEAEVGNYLYLKMCSKLDAVFHQLSLSSDTENCREKLICLMYTNPAKYAPYSNLVSAQLSRELNELKKPTSDNPEILRFFKYMKAAKDGQDQSDCNELHKCSSLHDSTNPTMINTFNDINKLVEARKMGKNRK
uniref:CSON013601 protein n=1 Tax=Culicoides sonorensis TaxID=179676 RepID=A0A336M8E8_CULSO